MKLLSFALVFALLSCSSQKEISEEEKLAMATDACLEDIEASATWGECNVKRTIYDRAEELQQCEDLAGKLKKQDRPMVLQIHVRPNGKVKQVKADPNGFQNPPLEACLAKEISKLRFAAPPKGAKPVINFPYLGANR